MFGFGKKSIHEPEEQQIKDLENYPALMRDLILIGESCDQITGAIGEYGRAPTNPIPVNGLLGIYKYLGKLSAPSGISYFFHRVCSVNVGSSKYPIDVYELVAMDSSTWDLLFIDMYHPRRSNIAPKGMTLRPYEKKIGDHPFAYGVDSQLQNFP